MGWHLSGITITRIRVIGGKFQCNFDLGKGILVRVSGEFELTE